MRKATLLLRTRRNLYALSMLLAGAPTPSVATVAVVPDDFSTIQSALDARPDSVIVRAGNYNEDILLFRGVVIEGHHAGDRPQLARIRIDPADDSSTSDMYSVRSVNITAGIELHNTRRAISIAFDRCDVVGGVVDASGQPETGTIALTRCDIRGDIRVLVRGTLLLDSCHVAGKVSAGWYDATLALRYCELEGDGTGTGIASEGFPVINQASIHHCLISGFDHGMAIVAENRVYIGHNRIENCNVAGIRVARSADALVDSNHVASCGVGIIVDNTINATVRGNWINHARDVGIWMDPGASIGDVIGNVVSNGANDGIILSGVLERGSVAGNTSVRNLGSGYVMTMGENAYSEPIVVRRNIGAGNGRYGIEWWTEFQTIGGCNDWFENGSGEVMGRELSKDDFVAEPMFCDPDRDDYALDSASSLLARCMDGVVGALGVGCGKTATLIERFLAARVSDGIRVLWEVAQGATAAEIWLERSKAGEEGPWVRPVTERSFESRAVVELDRSTAANCGYWYRLVALEDNEPVVIGPPIVVEAQPRLGFRLAEVGPNPGGGHIRIGFAVKHTASIEIDVFDVQGRKVATPARGIWSAGSHVVEWNGLTDGGERTPPGLYVLRYAYPGGQDRRAIVRVK